MESATAKMNNKEVGNRITQAREEAKLTKAELAAKVQVSPSTIQRYEEGKIEKNKMPVIKSIADALEIDPTWLIGGISTNECNNSNSIVTQGNNTNTTINHTTNNIYK